MCSSSCIITFSRINLLRFLKMGAIFSCCSSASVYEFSDHHQSNSTARYECLVFDLDDTLYPLSSGISEVCTKNIQEYMVQKLGIEESKVAELNQVLYRNYGTSLAGLKAVGYEFDNDDYHSFVHGRLPYENLKPDPVLRSLLLSLPLRKIVFSNGDKVHVAKALKLLGIEDCFEMVISFETLNPSNNCSNVVICKPSEIAFEQAFNIAKIDPQKTLFFDDSIRNIQTGKRMGLHTILVGTSDRKTGADYALESVHNIEEAFPDLWNKSNEKKSKRVVRYENKVSINTPVT